MTRLKVIEYFRSFYHKAEISILDYLFGIFSLKTYQIVTSANIISDDSHIFSHSVYPILKKDGVTIKSDYDSNKSDHRIILIDFSGIRIIENNNIPVGFNRFSKNVYLSDLIYIITTQDLFRRTHKELLKRLIDVLDSELSHINNQSVTNSEIMIIEKIRRIIRN